MNKCLFNLHKSAKTETLQRRSRFLYSHYVIKPPFTALWSKSVTVLDQDY